MFLHTFANNDNNKKVSQINKSLVKKFNLLS